MNTLQLIKKQINKASAVHDAQITHTAYRGVTCEVRKPAKESHGTFCYRGRTYVKRYGSTTNCRDRIPKFCSISFTDIRRD